MNLPRLHTATVVPDELVLRLLSRDIALWLGSFHSIPSAELASLTSLAGLPWRMVVAESSDARLVTAAAATHPELSRRRGQIFPVTRNPADLVLPPRSLPLFFLNGRDDAKEPEDSPSGLGQNNRQLRRLAMLNQLVRSVPPAMLLVPAAEDDIEDLLGETVREVRSRIFLVSSVSSQREAARAWIKGQGGPPDVTLIDVGLADLTENLSIRLRAQLPDDQVSVRVRIDKKQIVSRDVTNALPVDAPILDQYVLVNESFLVQPAPEDLTDSQINQFFARTGDERNIDYWRAYGAGLPFERDDGSAKRRLLESLQQVSANGVSSNKILTVPSEPGAGGTTTVRYLAHAAAREGYLTLIARETPFVPRPDELANFMYRVDLAIHDGGTTDAPQNAAESNGGGGLPWLLVFDLSHWRGREDQIAQFLKAMERFARPVVILYVTDPSLGEYTGKHASLFPSPLSHTLSEEEVDRLGRHVNLFLAPKGRAQPLDNWKWFWRENTLRPEPGTLGLGAISPAFWVALEFWLRRHLDLGESIRKWLFSHFKNATYRNQPLGGAVRRAVLLIASLAVEREVLPEPLLPSSPPDEDPLTAQLEEIARLAPALSLTSRQSDRGRSWLISHVPIARHLLSALADDPEQLAELGFAPRINATALRLEVLATLAASKRLGDRRFYEFGTKFAVSIFKLDRGGNQEYARYWRDVLNALFMMPDVFWDGSRLFLHHAAISRRRVATDNALFPDKKPPETLKLLEGAIEDLEFALTLPPGDDKETDLNLLNSLARAYQDLADFLEPDPTAAERVKALREKELDTLERAESLNPSNSHLLETSARSLIARAKRFPADRLRNACLALQRIYLAHSLDTARDRRLPLEDLTAQAYRLLEALESSQLESLRTSNPSLAAVVQAWLLLRGKGDSVDAMTKPPTERLDQAVALLESVPAASRDWPVNRLLYELISARRQFAFEDQLRVLEMLEGTPAMQVQLQLERAILLHQVGNHEGAEREFRDIRHKLKDLDIYITVPKRLAWYRAGGSDEITMCDGKVVPSQFWTRHAMRVTQLGHSIVGFEPLDFGQTSITPGTLLKCRIGFNIRGAYAKEYK